MNKFIIQHNSDIEDFEIFVDESLWEQAKRGDEAAVMQLRDDIDGIVVYFHNFTPSDNMINVSLNDLIIYDVIRSMTIHAHDVGR